ncbi:MAG: ABC transporter ATP-binding protein [Paracoccaceae bacterium]
MLSVEGITAFYGPSQALFGVSFEVGPGEVVALMGRNGMGKTTTIRAVCRLTPPRDGRVVFEGRDLAGLPAHRAARLGLGLAPEGRRCFPNLTVAENMFATARPGLWDRAKVEGLFPRLAERRGQYARTLSGGEQQMLAIGRALCTNPRLLILDEATEGLAPVIRQEIRDALRTLKAEGQAILIVDKSLAELREIADRGVILEKGEDVWTGAMDALTADVVEARLGV